MTFFLRGSWVCGFLEPDLTTPVCRRRMFGAVEKLRELIARTPTRLDQADKQAFEYAVGSAGAVCT